MTDNSTNPAEPMPFQLIEGGKDQTEEFIPPYLTPIPPPVSNLIAVDERVPLITLFRALAKGGFAVINARDGRLIVTHKPGDFR